MSAHAITIEVLLGFVVLSSWIGALGMLRMRYPVQALHYLTFPAAVGMAVLIAAVFFELGFGQASVKTLLTGLVLLGINSVVAHATARAFRARELGHWQPRDGDPMEWVSRERHPHGEQDT